MSSQDSPGKEFRRDCRPRIDQCLALACWAPLLAMPACRSPTPSPAPPAPTNEYVILGLTSYMGSRSVTASDEIVAVSVEGQFETLGASEEGLDNLVLAPWGDIIAYDHHPGTGWRLLWPTTSKDPALLDNLLRAVQRIPLLPVKQFLPSPQGDLWYLDTGSGSASGLCRATAARIEHIHLPDGILAPRAPSLSPDGRHLAFYFAPRRQDIEGPWPSNGLAVASLDQSVRVVVPAGPVSMRVIELNRPPRWTHDGRYLYFCLDDRLVKGQRIPASGDNGRCQRLDLQTGQVQTIAKGTLWAMPPDASYVLLELGTSVGHFRMFDPITSKAIDLPGKDIWPEISPSGAYAAMMHQEADALVLRIYRTRDWSRAKSVRLERRRDVGGALKWISKPTADSQSSESPPTSPESVESPP